MDTEEIKSGMIKIKVIVLAIVLIGTAIYMYSVYSAAKDISTDVVSVSAPRYAGDGKYEVSFTLAIKNPHSTAVEIKGIKYNVYINGEYLGNGEKGSFTLSPGETKYSFKLLFTLSDLSSSASAAVLAGGGTITIKGTVMVPVKLLGLVTWTTVEIPFENASKL